MSQFYISAAHKSSGKTTISIGLAAALSENHKVQFFKKGPDYIDPMWLAQASNNPVYNLDFYTSSNQHIVSQYNKYQKQANITLVEGNKGLYDGMNVDGSDSNAGMAKLLKLPVILVLDTQGISRGIAPLINGYTNFDKGINFSGIILNKVAGTRHESKLLNAIEHYCDLPVIGSVFRDKTLEIEERHLGLIPSNELSEHSINYINKLKNSIQEGVDLQHFKPSHLNTIEPIPLKIQKNILRIAIARDPAFGFYYADDLLRFSELGVELVEFNTLTDISLPSNIDALFIGGGFPETHLGALSQNISLLSDIKNQIQQGLPSYAECGGLMYLSQSISYQGEKKSMVGIIESDVTLHPTPKGRGYIQLKPTKDHPWGINDETLSGHEFHYSSLDENISNQEYAYNMIRGTGINSKNDGIIRYNLLANYCHLRQTDQCHWIDQFVQFIKTNKLRNTKP